MKAVAITWIKGENRPPSVPDHVDIPLGIEVEYNEQQNKKVVKAWLEAKYRWGVNTFHLINDDQEYW